MPRPCPVLNPLFDGGLPHLCHNVAHIQFLLQVADLLLQKEQGRFTATLVRDCNHCKALEHSVQDVVGLQAGRHKLPLKAC